MITFGAVIGKINHTQIIWIVFALNQHLINYTFKALDHGETICINMFGAYYCLAISIVLRNIYHKNQDNEQDNHLKYTSAYLNDIFSRIRTLFL